MKLSITSRQPYAPPVEFVERKGVGHPDTICDALAEDLARSLATDYLAETGNVQHFNVDKAVLAAGTVDIGFGGGSHTKPSYLVLVGKADFSHGWKPDPDKLAYDTKVRLLDLLPDATPEAFTVAVWLNQSSVDLANVVKKGHRMPVPLANDTSFAAVSFPRSPLEEAVHRVEHLLNSDEFRTRLPIGRDIKVMGARMDDRVEITVAVPVLAIRVESRSAYDDVIAAVRDAAAEAARNVIGTDVEVRVNQADTHDSQYLTLSGTSAEAGDDGQVGRGNRFGGLITPYRPMSLEATAGKNPAAHVGKTYHAFAEDIAHRIVSETDATETTIRMLSSIGHPVTEPQVVHIEIVGGADDSLIESYVKEALADWVAVRDRLIAGEYELY
jgi:S-adenosylmethionine synthetase